MGRKRGFQCGPQSSIYCVKDHLLPHSQEPACSRSSIEVLPLLLLLLLPLPSWSPSSLRRRQKRASRRDRKRGQLVGYKWGSRSGPSWYITNPASQSAPSLLSAVGTFSSLFLQPSPGPFILVVVAVAVVTIASF